MSDTPLSNYRPKYTKRRRTPSPPPPDPYADYDQESDSTKLYVPVKQRRTQLLNKLGGAAAASVKKNQEEEDQEREEREREQKELENKKLRERTLLVEAQEVKKKRAEQGENTLSRRGGKRNIDRDLHSYWV